MDTVAFQFWLCVSDSLAKWLWLRQELWTFTSWTTWKSLNSLESPYTRTVKRYSAKSSQVTEEGTPTAHSGGKSPSRARCRGFKLAELQISLLETPFIKLLTIRQQSANIFSKELEVNISGSTGHRFLSMCKSSHRQLQTDGYDCSNSTLFLGLGS